MSGLLARRAKRSGAFNPQTSIPWHSLFWAEGTDFVALGLADAAEVSTWPNETGETDATQATPANRPLYRASVAKFNSKPGVDFDGSNDFVQTGAFGVNPSYTSGVTIVQVHAKDTTADVRVVFDRGATGTQNTVYSQTASYRYTAGTSFPTAGSITTDARFIRATFDGGAGNETFRAEEGTSYSSSTGSGQLASFTMGGGSSGANLWDGEIAFTGIYEGDITAHGSWADFKTWITDHYGITLS